MLFVIRFASRKFEDMFFCIVFVNAFEEHHNAFYIT